LGGKHLSNERKVSEEGVSPPLIVTESARLDSYKKVETLLMADIFIIGPNPWLFVNEWI
jgi:hypothetical protein